MKRLISILLVYALVHAVTPQPRQEANGNIALACMVLAIGIVAGCATIYVMTHYPKPQQHTMVLETLRPPELVWTPVATNVITMDPDVFYEAFHAWAISNHVQAFFRVREIPKLEGFTPSIDPGSLYQPVLY